MSRILVTVFFMSC